MEAEIITLSKSTLRNIRSLVNARRSQKENRYHCMIWTGVHHLNVSNNQVKKWIDQWQGEHYINTMGNKVQPSYTLRFQIDTKGEYGMLFIWIYCIETAPEVSFDNYKKDTQ